MRNLYEEIQEFYLLNEGLSKEPTSPIEDHKDGANRSTNLTNYNNSSDFEEPAKYHKDYTGVTHLVSWENKKSKDSMSDKEKKDSLHDAMHLHNHFVKHGTEVGDVVKNTPIEDQDGSGGNKRARIYGKKAGFGSLSDAGIQYGTVKQHSHDHPDENKRGEKYVHPLEHHEIKAHGDAPSTGASDNVVRHLTKKFGSHMMNSTKYNTAVHHIFSNSDNPNVHQQEHINHKIGDKTTLNNTAVAQQHAIKRFTKSGDTVG